MENKFSIALSFLMLIASATSQTDQGPDLKDREYADCMTSTNTPGKCVPHGFCDSNNRLTPNVPIDFASLRSAMSPCDSTYWCCEIVMDQPRIGQYTQSPPATNTTGCATTEKEDCPWCVKLYTSSKRLLCLGAMIGSTVVLTAATCLLVGGNGKMYAQVPSSADPNIFYEVKYRQKHNDYNSGTHKFDFALLTVDEVKWGPDGSKGACYKADTFMDNCMGAGLDENDNIVMTSLSVHLGYCGRNSNVPDVACGEPESSNCNVVMGAPVMCLIDNVFVLWGVASSPCSGGTILLGNLEQSKTWLINTLKGAMALQEKDFLYAAN